MKSSVKMAIVGVVAVAASAVYCFSPKDEVKDLVLENAEALATPPYYLCLGMGTMTCPDGSYVSWYGEGR